MLEEWEAAQRIEPPAVFLIRKLDIGEGYYIRAALPNGETEAIYGFDDPIAAQDWIDRESRQWVGRVLISEAAAASAEDPLHPRSPPRQ